MVCVRFKLIMTEELPDISSFKRTGQFTVIVFDDLAGEPLATQLKIVPFFRSGRYDGISSIYIAQYFYETHPNICTNLKYILLDDSCFMTSSIFIKKSFIGDISVFGFFCMVNRKSVILISIKRYHIFQKNFFLF